MVIQWTTNDEIRHIRNLSPEGRKRYQKIFLKRKNWGDIDPFIIALELSINGWGTTKTKSKA